MPDSFSKRQRERDRRQAQEEKQARKRAKAADNRIAPEAEISPDEAPAAPPGFHR